MALITALIIGGIATAAVVAGSVAGATNNIKSSEDELKKREQEKKMSDLAKNLGQVKRVGPDRAYALQKDPLGIKGIRGIRGIRGITGLEGLEGITPTLGLTGIGQKWVEVDREQVDSLFNDDIFKSVYMDYSDPQQVNDLIDVASRQLMGRGGFIENWDMPEWAKYLLRYLTPIGGADMLWSDFNNLIYDTTGAGNSLLQNWFFEPIKQRMEGKIDSGEMWKAIGINTLMAAGQTLDVLANPIKGLFKEGPAGLAKGLGFNADGRVNYDYDFKTGAGAGDFIVNLILEIISDPVSYVTFGGAALAKAGIKYGFKVGMEVTEDLLKVAAKAGVDLGLEVGEKLTKQAVRQMLFYNLKLEAKAARSATKQIGKAGFKATYREGIKGLISVGADAAQSAIRASTKTGLKGLTKVGKQGVHAIIKKGAKVTQGLLDDLAELGINASSLKVGAKLATEEVEQIVTLLGKTIKPGTSLTLKSGTVISDNTMRALVLQNGKILAKGAKVSKQLLDDLAELGVKHSLQKGSKITGEELGRILTQLDKLIAPGTTQTLKSGISVTYQATRTISRSGGGVVAKEFAEAAGSQITTTVSKNFDSVVVKTMGKTIDDLAEASRIFLTTGFEKGMNITQEIAELAADAGVKLTVGKVLTDASLKALTKAGVKLPKHLLKEGTKLFKEGTKGLNNAITRNLRMRLQEQLIEMSQKSITRKLVKQGFYTAVDVQKEVTQEIVKRIQRVVKQAVTNRMTAQLQATIGTLGHRLAVGATKLDNAIATAAFFGLNKLVVKGAGAAGRGFLRGVDNVVAAINNRSVMRVLAGSKDWSAHTQLLLRKGIIPLHAYQDLAKQFTDVYKVNFKFLEDTTVTSTADLTKRQVKQINKINTNSLLNHANPFAEQMTRQLNSDVTNFLNITATAADANKATEAWQRYLTQRYGGSMTPAKYSSQVAILNAQTGGRFQNQLNNFTLNQTASEYRLANMLAGSRPKLTPKSRGQIIKTAEDNAKVLSELQAQLPVVQKRSAKTTIKGVEKSRLQIKLARDAELRQIVFDWTSVEEHLHQRVTKNFSKKYPLIFQSKIPELQWIKNQVAESHKFHNMLSVIGNDARLVMEGFEDEDVRSALLNTLLGLKGTSASLSNRELAYRWVTSANMQLQAMSDGSKHVDFASIAGALEEHLNMYRRKVGKTYEDIFKPLSDWTDGSMSYRLDAMLKNQNIHGQLADEIKALRLEIIASTTDYRYSANMPMYLTRVNAIGLGEDFLILDGQNPMSVSAYLQRYSENHSLTTERSLSGFFMSQYFDWDESMDWLDLGNAFQMNKVAQSASQFKTRILPTSEELIDSNAVSIQRSYATFKKKAAEVATEHGILNPFELMKDNLSNKDAFAFLLAVKDNISELPYEFRPAFKSATRGQTALKGLLEDPKQLTYNGIRMDSGYFVQQAANAQLSPDTERAIEALNAVSSLNGLEASYQSLETLFKNIENLDPMVFEHQEQWKIISDYKRNVQLYYQDQIKKKLDAINPETGRRYSSEVYDIMEDPDTGGKYFTDEHFETLERIYTGQPTTSDELIKLDKAVQDYNEDRLDFDRLLRNGLPTSKQYASAKNWLMGRDVPDTDEFRSALAKHMNVEWVDISPSSSARYTMRPGLDEGWVSTDDLKGQDWDSLRRLHGNRIEGFDFSGPTRATRLRELITQREPLSADELKEWLNIVDGLGDWFNFENDIPFDLIPNSIRYALQHEELAKKGIGITFSLNQRANPATIDAFNKQYNLNSARAYSGLDGVVNMNNKEVKLYVQSILDASQKRNTATFKISQETAEAFAFNRWNQRLGGVMDIQAWNDPADFAKAMNIDVDEVVDFRNRLIQAEINQLKRVGGWQSDFYHRLKQKSRNGIVLSALGTLDEREWLDVMGMGWGFLEQYPKTLEQLYAANYIEAFLNNPKGISPQFNMNNTAVRRKTLADLVTGDWEHKIHNENIRALGAKRGLIGLPDMEQTLEQIPMEEYSLLQNTMYERILANSDFANASNPFVVKEAHLGEFLDPSTPNQVADAYAQRINQGFAQRRIEQAQKRLIQSPKDLAQDIANSGPAIIYFYDDLRYMGRTGKRYFDIDKAPDQRLTASGKELRDKFGVEIIFDDEQGAALFVGDLNRIWYGQDAAYYVDETGRRVLAQRPDTAYRYTSLGSPADLEILKKELKPEIDDLINRLDKISPDDPEYDKVLRRLEYLQDKIEDAQNDLNFQNSLNTTQLDHEYLAGQTTGWGDGTRLDMDFYRIMVNGFDDTTVETFTANQAGRGYTPINYWRGLNEDAQRILEKQGWGKIGENGFEFTGLDNALHYNPNRFNEMLMGSTAQQRRMLPYLSNNPVVQMNKNIQEAGMLAKTQTTYVHNMLDDQFSINKGVFADFSDAQLHSLLQSHPQMRVVQLVPKSGKRAGFGIREFIIIKPSDVTKAREAGARIIPESVYKRLYNTLNNRVGSSGFLKVWNRLMYVYKFAYLGLNIGTATRNYIDTNLKTNIELGLTDATFYRREAAALMGDFINLSQTLDSMSVSGFTSNQFIRDNFLEAQIRAGVKAMDVDTFFQLKDFIKYGPMSNITESATRATRQINNTQPDMWQKFVNFTGDYMGLLNRTEEINRIAMFLQGLDTGMTKEAAYHRISKVHFDYAFRNKPSQMLETLFPFMTFTLRNAEYWLQAIEQHSWIVPLLANIMTPVWNFDEYSPQQLQESWQLQNQILNGNINLFTLPNKKDATLKINPSFMDAFQTVVSPVEVLQNRLFTPVSQLVDVMTGKTDVNGFVNYDSKENPSYYQPSGNMKGNTLMKTLRHWANYVPAVGPLFNSVYSGLDQGSPLPSMLSIRQPAQKFVKRPPFLKVVDWNPQYRNTAPQYSSRLNRPIRTQPQQFRNLTSQKAQIIRQVQMYKTAKGTLLGNKLFDPYKAVGRAQMANMFLAPKPNTTIKVKSSGNKQSRRQYALKNYGINRAQYSRP